FAFNNDSFASIINTIVKAFAGTLTADLTKSINDLLGINLAPQNFVAETGNAKVRDYIGDSETWAEVWDAHSEETTTYDWEVTDRDSFVSIALDLIKPFDSILSFVLMGTPLEFSIEGVELQGGRAYETAINPLIRALGIETVPAATANEAVGNLVDYVFELVDELSAAPVTTILNVLSNLSFLIANDNLEPLIKNLTAPILGILDLVSSIISRDQLDGILKGLIGLGLTDIIEIGNNSGANLIGFINDLIEGVEIKDNDDNVVYTINLLPDDFFIEFSKYAINVKDVEHKDSNIGTPTNDWDVNTGNALMYLLSTVLSENFLKSVFTKLNLNINEGIGAALLSIVDKEYDLADIIIMLLNEYSFSYKRINQVDLNTLDGDKLTPYFGKLNNENTTQAIEALDPLLISVLGIFGIGDLQGEIDSLIAEQDIGNLIMNALVPALAKIDIDAILEYVNGLTNLNIESLAPQAFTATNFGSKLKDYIGSADTWAEVLEAHSEDATAYDWEIKSTSDLVNFACDLLAPLDEIFQIILCGKQIIAVEDKSAERADIRINGGYGYNYAIIPLLEAFGVTPLSQADYEAKAKDDGSSIKYILDSILAEVNTILDAPVKEVLSRIANIFYFIGSDGINVIADNLLAPINEVLKEVDGVFPIAIKIDIAAEKIIETYFGKEHDGVEPGITINLSGEDLADFINSLIGEIDINGTIIKLHLDLDWNGIAAKMAAKNANGEIIYKPTKQVYTLDTCEDGNELQNISGDPADALVTILDTVLSVENCENIKNLVEGLLKDVTLDESIKKVISDILNDPNAIKNLVASIVLILTKGYTAETLEYVYKFLGSVDYVVDGIDDAITSLDKILLAAVPVIIDMVADTSKSEEEQSFIDKLAIGLGDKPATLDNIVDYLFGTMLFTNEMMNKITSALVKGLGSAISENLADTLKDLLGIDLAPKAFAVATGNAELVTYVGESKTWAEVLDSHSTVTGTDAEGNDIIAIDPIFANADSKDGFIGAILDMLKPLDSILGFILTGEDLIIKSDDNEIVRLDAGDAYNTAILPLAIKALGLKEFGATEKSAATANDALKNTLDYVFLLIDELQKAPVSVILTVVSNLSFFIANNDVSVAIQNLISPILAIVNALDNVITRDQLNTLLKGFIGMGLDDIIYIADNGGAKLVELINKYLGTIDITDSNGDVVYVLNALPSTFFKDLAMAAIKIDEPENVTAIGTDVTEWHSEKGDAIMYVLSTVLSKDFLEILCSLLNVESGSDIEKVITSLAGKENEVVGVLLKLLNKYLVEYKPYTQPVLDKISVDYKSDASHKQLNSALAGLDNLIPVILGFIGDGTAENLGDIVYPLFVKDDIANMLVSTVVKLLAGLPTDTINKVIGYVNDLTNLKDIDIAPQAFTAANFGSKLKAYIGSADTWTEVWEAHSEETTAEDGTVTRTATAYDWGIESTSDLVNLVCDMLNPLDGVLALILMGGTDRAQFEADGTHNGSKITAFDEINVIGGNGYNYAIIPVLELLGVQNVKTQAEYEAYVKANHGSTLKYILDAVFDRVDEILNAPIASVIDILANLCYVIGNDNVETVIANLIAPINNIIEAVDKLYPIAINVNLGNIGTDKEIAEMYIGKQHPGVAAGISVALKGTDIASLINTLLAGIEVNGQPLNISLDLDWLALAATAAADDGNGKIKLDGSKLDTSYDIYNGGAYKNVVADPGDTFVALLKTVLTEENYEAILKAIGKEDGFGEPLDGIIDQIIENPALIIDLIASLLGDAEVSYVPIQNRSIKIKKFDYSTYFVLTEANADIIAQELDGIINTILGKTSFGSIKNLVCSKYITNDTINLLLDKIVPLLGGETVDNIITAIAGFSKDNPGTTDLDFTVGTFYEKFIDNVDYTNPTNVNIREGAKILKAAADKEGGSWKDVGSFAGTNWGFKDGDIQGFARTLADILKPLNSVLELLLMGEGKEINILDIVKLEGGNGYDYAIIPILEAFGLKAEEVKTLSEYKTLVSADDSQLLGYVLERVATFADRLLSKPVDTLLTILPNLAYFISNEGVYLAVRNLIAPVFTIVNTVTSVFGIDLAETLNVSKLLHNINIPIQLLGAKYDFKIPEIDFYKLAQYGGSEAKEVRTSRTKAANSFVTPTDPYPYINDYPEGKYDGWENKTTQTNIVSDKGDTLTMVLTWALEMFGDAHNREALVNWLADVFQLQSGAKQVVAYGINTMFDTCSKYQVPDIIVASLFEFLGIGLQISATVSGDMVQLQKIYQQIFDALSSNTGCLYSAIAKVMEELTGTWNETVGDHDDYHDAVDEAEESLNWFQRLLKKIKEFFQKLFGIFK
ncbi:MAG: hypothetical protein ACI4GY_11110, partial [Acutalibacteraceae bacterium]